MHLQFDSSLYVFLFLLLFKRQLLQVQAHTQTRMWCIADLLGAITHTHSHTHLEAIWWDELKVARRLFAIWWCCLAQKKWLQTTSSKKNCLPQTRERSPDLRAACMHYNTIKLRGAWWRRSRRKKIILLQKRGNNTHTLTQSVVRTCCYFFAVTKRSRKKNKKRFGK